MSSLTVSELVDQEHECGLRLGPFERFHLLSKRHVPERVRRYLVLAKEHPEIVNMPQQGFTGLVTGPGAVNTVAFGARNTSLAELNMLQDNATGAAAATTQAIINQYCAIPPTDIFPGKVYELKMFGTYGNTATPTMIFTPRWGTSTTPATNITLGANAAWTSITGTTGLPYHVEFTFAIRTTPPGATIGTGKGFGHAHLGIPITSSQVVADVMFGGTAATIDTSGQGAAGCGLTMNLTWSASSASNTSTCEIFKIYARD